MPKKTPLDLKKTFPDTPCVSQMLGGPSFRRGIPRELLSIPQGIGWSGNDTGRLVTWQFPLRTDSTSLKSLESFIQLTSFCTSWILAVSSVTVSRSSNHFLLENVSNVHPWNRFNYSISLRLFTWASRSSRFCSNNCSWTTCWSRRNCSSRAWARLISPRWDSMTPTNFGITRTTELLSWRSGGLKLTSSTSTTSSLWSQISTSLWREWQTEEWQDQKWWEKW